MYEYKDVLEVPDASRASLAVGATAIVDKHLKCKITSKLIDERAV